MDSKGGPMMLMAQADWGGAKEVGAMDESWRPQILVPTIAILSSHRPKVQWERASHSVVENAFPGPPLVGSVGVSDCYLLTLLIEMCWGSRRGLGDPGNGPLMTPAD